MNHHGIEIVSIMDKLFKNPDYIKIIENKYCCPECEKKLLNIMGHWCKDCGIVISEDETIQVKE